MSTMAVMTILVRENPGSIADRSRVVKGRARA
jgi:hypothetical protein